MLGAYAPCALGLMSVVTGSKLRLSMKTLLSLLNFMFLVVVGPGAHAGSATYTTSRGQTFTQVEMSVDSLGWRDPSGRVWSDCLGSFTNKEPIYKEGLHVSTDTPATKICESRGASLPSIEDSRSLFAYFMD